MMGYPYQAYSPPGAPLYAEQGSYRKPAKFVFRTDFTGPNGPLSSVAPWHTVPGDVSHVISSDTAIPDPTTATTSGNYILGPSVSGMTVDLQGDYNVVSPAGHFAQTLLAGYDPVVGSLFLFQFGVDLADYTFGYYSGSAFTSLGSGATGAGPGPNTFEASVSIIDPTHVEGSFKVDGEVLSHYGPILLPGALTGKGGGMTSSTDGPFPQPDVYTFFSLIQS